MKDGAVDNIGDGLRGKNDGGIRFTQDFEPLTDFRRKLFVVKEYPTLIQNNDRRLSL